MKLQKYLFIFLIIFSITSCSQPTISNKYYGTNNTIKKFNVNVEINRSNKNLTVNEVTFEISNINSQSNELQKIYQDSSSNDEFIKNISAKIINTLDNIGFDEEIEYNFLQQSKNNNLLFTKRSELGDINTKTLLITTTYFNSNNEFSPKNISIIFEILRLFENFTKKYHLSILFVNNSSSFSNSIDSSLNDVLYLDILSIIDLQFENTLNKVNVLNLNTESKISTFVNDSIKFNSFNFINSSEIIDKTQFNNILNNNIDFIRIVSETNVTDITKCANFLIEIISDILNKPTIPSVSTSDSIFRVTLDLSNHNSVKKILYKINDGEYSELTEESILEVDDYITIKIKFVDLFNNHGDELSLKLF
ncbi:Hypothetical protein SFBmNL_00520 [Candidatus Arthromitus sp. SFB-mouse-NL]|uniref:hypothetical protein n=1 Tax=Candidatus Arthromitus sp. SFB-mouse-NL TaxID=1508644 RepID=UPI00049B46D1|nr:hypothetical protein [Candidatus Arthromitus sp. SFB-mouse-NL]AID44429.1 Hypothetical protein SFBmNL_00520 [Candidatus Arthromitus sp. SFB-mouse-NL]